MRLLLCLTLAFVVTNAQEDLRSCVTKFRETLNKAHGFYGLFMKFKEQCVSPDDEEGAMCGSELAGSGIGECLPPKKMEMMMAMKKAGMLMFEYALNDVGDELMKEGVCKPPTTKPDPKKMLGDKEKMFQGEKCKEGMMHSLMPQGVRDCVHKCVIKKFLNDPNVPQEVKGHFTVENLDAKIAWLEDPLNNEPPASVKDMDIKSAGLCIFNVCEKSTVEKVIKKNVAFRTFMDVTKAMKKRMKSGEGQKKMVKFCECMQSNEVKIPGGSCQNAPKMMEGKNTTMCIEKKREMMQDIKKSLQEVLSGD